MELTHAEWLKLTDFIAITHKVNSRDELETLVIESLPAVIPVDFICWNEHKSDLAFTALSTTASHKQFIDGMLPVVNETVCSHPLVRALDMANGFSEVTGVHALEDYATLNQVRETAIYQEVYRHSSTNYQLAFHLSFSDGEGVLISANNSSPILERSRYKLEIIHPHLTLAGNRVLRDKRRNASFAQFCGNEALSLLTPRETETLTYVLQGKTNGEIGKILSRSPRTIEKHVASLLEKLGFENRKSLLAQAVSLS